MQLSRARRLSSASTVNQGASGMLVRANISSLARENSTQRSLDSRSMGLSFQRLAGSLSLERNLTSCSSSLTENQYLINVIPLRTNIRSNSGQDCINSST